jgi:hypothetical protein
LSILYLTSLRPFFTIERNTAEARVSVTCSLVLFDLRVMAITIRQAIDVVPRWLSANPNLDVEAYARELVTLFDRATALSIAPH